MRRIFSIFLGVAVLAGPLLGGAASAATLITLSPSYRAQADDGLNARGGDPHDGVFDRIRSPQSSIDVFAGNFPGESVGNSHRGLFSYLLPAAPAGQSLVSAEFVIRRRTSGLPVGAFEVHGLRKSSAAYSLAEVNSLSAASLVDAFPLTTASLFRIDVSSFVLGLDAGEFAGLVIRSDRELTAQRNGAGLIGDSTQLVLTYDVPPPPLGVPAPTSLLLALGGAIGLLRRR